MSLSLSHKEVLQWHTGRYLRVFLSCSRLSLCESFSLVRVFLSLSFRLFTAALLLHYYYYVTTILLYAGVCGLLLPTGLLLYY